MSKSNIEDLRTTLFDTLEKVKAGTMDLDRARQVNDVAKTIVDTARVEVDYLRATGNQSSQFMEPGVERTKLPSGVVSVTRHRIAG